MYIALVALAPGTLCTDSLREVPIHVTEGVGAGGWSGDSLQDNEFKACCSLMMGPKREGTLSELFMVVAETLAWKEYQEVIQGGQK